MPQHCRICMCYEALPCTRVCTGPPAIVRSPMLCDLPDNFQYFPSRRTLHKPFWCIPVQQAYSVNPTFVCCGSEEHPKVPEEALLTLIDLLTNSRANARLLVAARREGAALVKRYLRTCGSAGRQVHAACVPAWSEMHRMTAPVDRMQRPGSPLAQCA